MCLVAFALDQQRRFPLVIAANRDEYFSRPAARLAWWTPAQGGPAILGGRDLESGGTWLGLTAQGRLGLLTNIRDPRRIDPQAPSRGAIVPDWLSARESTDRFWMRTALSGYNGFNLVAIDFAQGLSWCASNQSAYPHRLERGVYGLSNAGLDTPWPKVQTLKARLRSAVQEAESVEALATRLFAALADRTPAADDTLPSTGIAIERERELSPAFIRTPDLSYGTRCSTLVITERSGRHLVTHVMERSFGVAGGVALLRQSTLPHWPPRYGTSDETLHHEQASVSESEVPADAGSTAPAKRTRVRSLLRPEPGHRRRTATRQP